MPSAFSSSGKTVSESQSQISSKRSRRSSGVKGLVSQSAMSKKAPAVRSHLTWRWFPDQRDCARGSIEEHRRASKSIALTSPNQPPAASKILPELQHSPHVSARTPARAGGRSPSASGRGRGSPGDLLGGEKGDHRRDVVRLPQLHELVRHHRRRHRPGTQQGRVFARIRELDLAELKRCRGRGLAQMHTCADAVQPRLGDAHVPAPGATTLTLMLRFSPSCARVLEKPTIPILAAE